jgi:predicted DNA-binding WGR domain protein
MKLEFSRLIFEKYSNMKFHENPSRGSGVFVPWGRIDGRTYGQRVMTKLIVTFRNCVNAPKNEVTRTINTPRRGYSQCISNAVSRCATQQAFWSF